MKSERSIIWIARILISIVTFLNLQAAVYFLLRPQSFAPGFELTGSVGNAMIRAMGLLFLMWNIPYIVAVINPLRHFVSLVEAVIMQAVGVVGETLILFTLGGQHPVIRSSVLRFIYFDGGGLVILLVAFFIVLKVKQKNKTRI
jgi:hypothetical protein